MSRARIQHRNDVIDARQQKKAERAEKRSDVKEAKVSNGIRNRLEHLVRATPRQETDEQIQKLKDRGQARLAKAMA